MNEEITRADAFVDAVLRLLDAHGVAVPNDPDIRVGIKALLYMEKTRMPLRYKLHEKDGKPK